MSSKLGNSPEFCRSEIIMTFSSKLINYVFGKKN